MLDRSTFTDHISRKTPNVHSDFRFTIALSTSCAPPSSSRGFSCLVLVMSSTGLPHPQCAGPLHDLDSRILVNNPFGSTNRPKVRVLNGDGGWVILRITLSQQTLRNTIHNHSAQSPSSHQSPRQCHSNALLICTVTFGVQR